MRNTLLTPLLAACLVISQVFMALHALDGDSHAEDEACEVCILAAGSEPAPGNSALTVPANTAHSPTDSYGNTHHTASVLPAFLARAPPYTLLHS